LLSQLLACDQFPGVACQESQHFEGLVLQLDLNSIPAQFAGPRRKLKLAESDCWVL
jgi:hypothetical protein